MRAIELDARRFRGRIQGDVIGAGDPGYDTARRVWNGTVDRRPLLIVRAAGTPDVVETIALAVREDLPLAVRGGGHSLPGFSTCDGGVVLDLSAMREVSVDSEARIARAGGGCRWSDFDLATHRHGLASTGGLISSTGVGGLTLGGGIGWLTRAAGLACDNLVGAEVVTAAGEVLEVGPSDHPDLFWALRGGGGNFGVVTRFDFRLHPVDLVTGGLYIYPLERAAELGALYRCEAGTWPDRMTTMLAFITAPAEAVPDSMAGTPAVAVVVCDCGDPDVAEADLRPFNELRPMATVVDRMPYPSLQSMFDAEMPAGDRYHFRGGFLDSCSESVIGISVEHMNRRPSPRSEIDLHHMGGAAGRIAADATAFPDRRSAFAYNVLGVWVGSAGDADNREWARSLAAEFDSLGASTGYVNFMTDQAEGVVAAAYGQTIYARLIEVKRRYDPQNVFKLNQNIRP